ncbi:DMT family transporter [Pseudaestuariivita atlantica]|uniref:Membrane protein n=1 Tax=Pseudaestuariivita atlantica TaxID=1317121 RepID=A0A0L1JP74_9RHOB|nr:DMT family transporter [Pseudaestuariivita atlantica]KNG93218.1 membrane protein [Pseudaestuariivita atlantica]
MIPASSNLRGAASASLAVMFFALVDSSIKFLSDTYALHQVVLIRSLVALALFLILIMPFYGGWQVFRTKRLALHILRGACVVFANLTFFLGLAEIPLADGVAIFFVSPLIITVMSVLFLRETVGPWRWTAVGLGLAGVLVMVRPGTTAFQSAALLPLAAAFGYAMLSVLTRKIGTTESAATMSAYIQIVFIAVCAVSGLILGDGAFAGSTRPALDFLFRAWPALDAVDWWLFLLIGAGSCFGGFLISQAYRLGEANFVAPFEYVAMPISVVTGFLVFGDLPDLLGWFGITLIIGAGLLQLWRETVNARRLAADAPTLRRG